MILRRRQIAMLKSMGISNRQINKLFILEGIFYGLDSLIYGTVIGLIILYIIYLAKVKINVYAFEIPWKNLAICFVTMYATIFISILSTKRKMKYFNIIDEIKKENI